MEHAEVVVVGGGPAGSTTAALLASEYKRDVLLLDSSRFPRSKPCAEYLSPGAIQLVEGQIGPISQLQPQRSLAGMAVRTPTGAQHLVQYRDRRGQLAPGAAVRRLELDAALLQAASNAGVRVLQGTRVERLLKDERGSVCGVLARPEGGAPVTIHTRLVVGADGANSLVANQLGVRRKRGWPNRLGLVAHLQTSGWPEDNGEMWIGPHGYVGVAPLDDAGLVSVGLVRPLPRGRLGSPQQALFQELQAYPALAQRLRGAEVVDKVQGVGPLARTVSAAGGRGFLLVGDAAGFIDPFTGEGIFRALRGAQVAANAASKALSRAPGPAIIRAEYDRARRQVFRDKEHLTWIIQAFVHFPGLMGFALDRLNHRPSVAARLGSVLGDIAPASHVLQPAQVWALVRP